MQPLSTAELHDAVKAVQKQQDETAALQARILARWESSGSWRDDGSLSAHARLSRDTGISHQQARHLLRRAKRLESMPLTSAAFDKGEISACRVDLLCRANQKDIHHLFLRDEEMLLAHVIELRYGPACRYIHYWLQRADQDSAKDKTDRQLRQRSCSISETFEGSVDLRALFDPIGGEIFSNQLKRSKTSSFELTGHKPKPSMVMTTSLSIT